MDKLISLQQAIDALCKSECGWNNAKCRHKDGTDFCVTCDNVKIIKSLPSAQPERKAGHWIEHENADIVDGYYVPKYECSCCHTWKHDDSDYCPDCGTKMCGTDGGEQE